MTYGTTKQKASPEAQVRPREDLPTPGPGALWCLDAQVRAAPGSGQRAGQWGPWLGSALGICAGEKSSPGTE